MSSTKALLRRIRRIEHEHASRIARYVGSAEEFEAKTWAGIEAGKYDRDDMPIIIHVVKRWLAEGR